MALAHGHGHKHTEDGIAPSDPTLSRFKFMCLVVIFGAAMLGGFSAVYLKTFTHRDMLMELGNCLAGGVFAAAGLLHMLPEAEASLRESFVSPNFPLGSLLCLFGILLPLYIERVLFDNVPRSDGHVEPERGLQGQVVSHIGHGHDHHLLTLMEPEHGAQGGPHRNPLLPYMMALLLSIHSLIEGVALGVDDTRAGATMIFLAIFAHKSLAAFSLGVTLTRADMSTKRFAHVMTSFSLMTPMGGLIGLMASASVTGAFQSLLSDVVTCIAAGTFVYIALLEILIEEFPMHAASPSGTSKNLKFACVVAGALLMTLMGLML
eukprot:a179508_55.p1 GENE.a179508_55~~a179508_55.p1  ORF type:complete len:343 (+),score=113.88 a179508_55:71-1030(+)